MKLLEGNPLLTSTNNSDVFLATTFPPFPLFGAFKDVLLVPDATSEVVSDHANDVSPAFCAKLAGEVN